MTIEKYEKYSGNIFEDGPNETRPAIVELTSVKVLNDGGVGLHEGDLPITRFKLAQPTSADGTPHVRSWFG